MLTGVLSNTTSGGSWISLILIYGVIIFAFYFFAIRPQKKQQKQKNALLMSLQVGDSILTSSGFYGVVIDIHDEVVIVEFGSNKNCRIPMKKDAIVDIEKSNEA